MEFGFDRLLIATGVKPRIPDIPGTGLKNVFTVISLQDALRIQEPLTSASSVAIVGAGYAGLEFAESLRALGKSVILFEREPHVLSSVDPDMAQIIEFELRRFGVQVSTSANVLALVGQDGLVNGVKAATSLGIVPADLVLLDTGVEPNVDLTQDTGYQDRRHRRDRRRRASWKPTFPGSSPPETARKRSARFDARPVLSAIGTVAAKQGRIAGENLAGRRSKFVGAIGTTVLKVFELGVARTGLTSREASAERISFVSARIEADDRASYYPGARKVWIKLIVDRESRKLIGAQAAGYGDVSKRIDVAATAISGGMTIDDVAQLDLAYSPPYSSLWDPLLVAAQAVIRGID